MTAITVLWLVALDRVGIAAVGGSVWCGVKGLWPLFSGHSALALVTALAVSAVVATGRGAVGWRAKLRAAAVAIVLTVVTAGLLYTPSIEKSAPYPWVQLSALTLPIGLATLFYTARRRKWWHYAPWAALSAVLGWVDATTYPGLVPEYHVGTYSVTVLTGTVGIGLPAAAWIRRLGGFAHRSALPALTALALAGLPPLWLTGRGMAAAVSPQLDRLVRKLPDPDPPKALARALRQPITEARDRPAPSFPRGKDRWSVLLITVDALRADALLETPERGFYIQPSDTPFLTEWLSKTFRFRSAYSQGTSTISSFRSMFHAVRTSEAAEGSNIPRIARALDVTTAAVIPPFFIDDSLYQTGLLQFERFDAYDLERQEEQVERLEQTLPSLGAERFFVWTHFYCTHDPVYTERGPGELSIKRAGEVEFVFKQYRDGVRWLDRQLARAIKALETNGQAGSTVVIVASDHGEHIGDGLRIGHGDGMHAPDIHVPLAILVPGAPGTVIDGVVGNIDILPTIIDLLGADAEPTHVGRSLVPLMQHNPSDSGRWYYVRGDASAQHAIVTGDDLFVYDEPLGAFQRFSRQDPLALGRPDAFGSNPARDATLSALMVLGNSDLFDHELDSPDVRSLLVQRLRAAAASSNEELDFLVGLAARSSDPELRAALEAALAAETKLDRKLRIVRHLIPRDHSRWLELLGDLLTKAVRTPAERPTLETFVRYDVPLVAPDVAAQRVRELAGSSDLPLIDAWLALLRTWNKPATFAAPLAALVTKHREAGASDLRRTRALLESTATLEIPSTERDRDDIGALAASARSLVEDPRVSVAQLACRALGAVGTDADIELLHRIANGNRSSGVRSAALRSSTKLKGPAAAMPYLKERVRDPVLAVTALDELVEIGDEACAAWLEGLAPSQNGVLVYVTKQSVKRLRRRLAAN